MWVQVFAGLIAKPAKGARGSVNGDPKWTEVRMRHTYPAQTLPRTGRAVISPGYWGQYLTPFGRSGVKDGLQASGGPIGAHAKQ